MLLTGSKHNKRRGSMKSIFLSLLGIAFLASPANASGPEDLFAKHFNQKSGVAVQGYDVVSYFKGAPAQGLKKFSVDYRGVVFLFSSQANANEFDASPEKFLPAYGGWCATAMGAMGKKLDINPTAYLILDGALYLFSTSMGPAKEDWIKSVPGIKQKADANWAKILAN
jgi:YHS domain-containing protein